jgi:NAD(P) transhydrogenase subunit alpha
MKVGVAKETVESERRVALVPDAAARLVPSGIELLVEAGAGEDAGFPDDAYTEAGAAIAAGATELHAEAELVCRVHAPSEREIPLFREGQALVAFLQPLVRRDLVRAIAERGVTAFSMDSIPRITRAQSMDALSSQATVAGYKAALLAAEHATRFFPMLTTAAGTIPPAKVLVIGAGVAGLQAIATARRLGAVVSAFDTRAVVKEQVESLGASFLEIGVEAGETAGGYATELSHEQHRLEQELIAREVSESDAVVTTAAIPGKPAPVLIKADAVASMRPGSVIVDLAADTGGNCELTVPGEVITHDGVTIVGATNLPSTMPAHASQMYSRNVQALLLHLVADGRLTLDFEDEITRETCVAHGGRALKDVVVAT